MATQLQRAYGLAEGKEPVEKKDAIKAAASRSEKKAGDKGSKGDPFPNLPRRTFAAGKDS